MSERPILMNTDMVRAILEGRKTVTRRAMKPQPVLDGHFWRLGGAGWGDNISSFHPVPCHSLYNHAPYHPGDILWVRETWAEMPYGFVYRVDGEEPDGWDCDDHWRPSIHMPRGAARIFLRVTGVRVERLQEITEDGAKAEGAEKSYPYTDPETGKTVFVLDEKGTYRSGFSQIWDRTIKQKDRLSCCWESTPWVWVIEFERCEKPRGFV